MSYSGVSSITPYPVLIHGLDAAMIQPDPSLVDDCPIIKGDGVTVSGHSVSRARCHEYKNDLE